MFTLCHSFGGGVTFERWPDGGGYVDQFNIVAEMFAEMRAVCRQVQKTDG